MTHIRRQKSTQDSKLRVNQIRESKEKAARFLTISDLRLMDQATYKYLERAGYVKDLRKFYNKKQLKSFNWCLDNDLNPSKTMDKIKADIELNIVKDGIKTFNDYKFFRASFMKYIRKNELTNEFIDLLSGKTTVPANTLKPVTPAHESQNDSDSVHKELMIKNMEISLTKLREKRNDMELNNLTGTQEYDSIVKRFLQLTKDIEDLKRNK